MHEIFAYYYYPGAYTAKYMKEGKPEIDGQKRRRERENYWREITQQDWICVIYGLSSLLSALVRNQRRTKYIRDTIG